MDTHGWLGKYFADPCLCCRARMELDWLAEIFSHPAGMTHE
jgi:hypothetical protein